MRKIFTLICLIVFLCIQTKLEAQNVGIGESGPQSKLSVKGNLSVGSGYSSTAAPANGAIIEGSVGIGNPTPAYKLDVSGDIRATGNFINGGFDFILGNQDQTTRGNSGVSRALVKDGGNVLSINYGNDFTGGTRIGSLSTGYVKTTGGLLSNVTSIPWGDITGAPAFITSYTETDPQVGGNSANYVPRWDGGALVSGVIQDNSTNVGISAAPDANVKLNVAGRIAMNDNDIRFRGPADANHLIGWRGTFASTVMDGPLVMGHQSGALGTNSGGDRIALFWNNSGNVGIGTQNPARSLEINNAMKFTNTSADANDGVIGTAPFAAGLNIVGINTDGGGRKVNWWGSLIQNENPVGNSFVGNTNFPGGIWNSSGYVGIGTTSPSHRLTINGVNDAFRIIGTGGAGSAGKFNFGDANYVYLEETVDDKLTIEASGGTRIGNQGTYTRDMYHGIISVGDNNANNCPLCLWRGWSGSVLEIQIAWSSLGIPNGTNKSVIFTADGNNNSYNDNWSVTIQQVWNDRIDVLIDRVDGGGWGLTTLRLHYVVMNND